MSRRRVTRVELVELLEVEEHFLVELERHEIVRPASDGTYDGRGVERVRICWSMYAELGVNMPGLEVALNLLERLGDDRRRLRELLDVLRER